MLNSNPPPLSGPPHFVDLHVNPGESVSIQLFDGNETILRGPATITMISQHTFPPIPMPVQVPPGHMIQQIVDENGTLRHIILSALNNNGGTPSANTQQLAMTPQQHQPQPQQQHHQQQPVPYCCCCCYSCTTPQTAPLPPPPPPPPPQVHHNIFALQQTQPNRRRFPNRTFSPGTKRASPSPFYNNNSFNKSPIKSNKLGLPTNTTTNGTSDVHVTKASYAKAATTSSDLKTSELTNHIVEATKVNNNKGQAITNGYLVDTCSVAGKKSLLALTNGCIGENGDHKVIGKTQPTMTNKNPVDQQNGTVCFENGDQKHYHLKEDSFKKIDSYNKQNKQLNTSHQHHHVNNNSSQSLDQHKPKVTNVAESTAKPLDKKCHQTVIQEEKPNSKPNDKNDSLCSYNSYHGDVSTSRKDDNCDTSSSSSLLNFSNQQYSNYVEITSKSTKDVVGNMDSNTNIEQSLTNHMNGDCVFDTKESHLSESSSSGVISADDMEVCRSVNKSDVVGPASNNTPRSDSCISDSKSIHDIVASLQHKSNEADQADFVSSNASSETPTSEKSQASVLSVNHEKENSTSIPNSSLDKFHALLSSELTKASETSGVNQASTALAVETNDSRLQRQPNQESSYDRLDDSCNESSDYDENDLAETESSTNAAGTTNRLKESPQRSPKHLLPELQLLNLTYTSLTANTVKLKWIHNQPHSSQSPHQISTRHYVVEMLYTKTNTTTTNCSSQGVNADHSSSSSSPNKPIATRIVYQGHSTTCRISHLNPQQQYSFRARTTSQDHLVVSNVLTITTPEQVPVSNKVHHSKKNKQQLLQQQIQQQQQQLHQQQLLLQQQQQQQQQANLVKEANQSGISSDQKCAIALLLAFTCSALVVAVIIQAFIRTDD